MKKACFVGCSFTVGEGFPEDQRGRFIYDRLLEKDFNFQRTNLAVGGASNDLIFMTAADALSQDHDVMVVQWSGLNRIWLYPKPGMGIFSNSAQDAPYQFGDIYMSRREKKDFFDRLRSLNHDYHNIIKLIDYCSILDRLSEYHGKRTIYINGLVPWTDDLLIENPTDLASELSLYTKHILDFDDRDDDEVLKFFKVLQEKFQKLDRSKWVNLFDSFQQDTTDLGPEGHHPGIESHARMAEKVKKYLLDHRIFGD